MVKFTAALALTLSLVATAQAQAQTPGSADGGKTLFMAIGCYQCHGRVGEGAPDAPRLLPNLLPFEAFAAQLRKPANVMPAYTAALVSDAQVADLYAYLKSIPASPKAADIPLLH